MKLTQDIKREYKKPYINKIITAYRTLKDIKENNKYQGVSPDTRKEILNESGRFSWFTKIDKKLTEVKKEYEKTFESKKVQKQIDLLDLEETTQNSLTTIESQEKTSITNFNEYNNLREIVDKDILNYPLQKTLYEIQSSMESIEQSKIRENKAKNADFISVLQEVKRTVTGLANYPNFSPKCDAVLDMHEMFFKHSKTKEEKEYHIKEILKLIDQLETHQSIVNYENNNRSFTSEFNHSNYSLTQEEAEWWINNQKTSFQIQKIAESFGVEDINDFERWRWLSEDSCLNKDKLQEIQAVVFMDGTDELKKLNSDAIVKYDCNTPYGLFLKQYELNLYLSSKNKLKEGKEQIESVLETKEDKEWRELKEAMFEAKDSMVESKGKEEVEKFFAWKETQYFKISPEIIADSIHYHLKSYRIYKFIQSLPDLEEFKLWASPDNFFKRHNHTDNYENHHNYQYGYQYIDFNITDENLLANYELYAKEVITKSIVNEILGDVFNQIENMENDKFIQEDMNLIGDIDV